MSDAYEAALDAFSSQHPDEGSMAQNLLAMVPVVSGVSVSTLGQLLGSETVSATDERIARIDELQFDLSVGPCWDALATRSPVIESDLVRRPSRVWPTLNQALVAEGVSAIFAFPLVVGPLSVGAIDMYRTEPGGISNEQQEQVVTVSGLISRQVLRRALDRAAASGTRDEGQSPFSRRVVHQATGFVIAQLGISADDALLLIHGQAFAEDRSVQEVAEDIVARRLRFSVQGNRIEDSS